MTSLLDVRFGESGNEPEYRVYFDSSEADGKHIIYWWRIEYRHDLPIKVMAYDFNEAWALARRYL